MSVLTVVLPLTLSKDHIESVMQQGAIPQYGQQEYSSVVIGPCGDEMPGYQYVKITSDHPEGFYSAGIAAAYLSGLNKNPNPQPEN